MDELDYIPVGRTYLTMSQKKDKRIKDLTFWVIILGTADIIYTSIMVMMVLQWVMR